MASAKGKVVVSTEVPHELRDATDARAKQEGRSRAEILTRAIRFYLEHAPVIHAGEIPAPKPSPPPKPRRRTTG